MIMIKFILCNYRNLAYYILLYNFKFILIIILENIYLFMYISFTQIIISTNAIEVFQPTMYAGRGGRSYGSF